MIVMMIMQVVHDCDDDYASFGSNAFSGSGSIEFTRFPCSSLHDIDL